MSKVNYNEISQVYDDVRQADIELINSFLQELAIDRKTRVLDIGCGTGNFIPICYRKLPKVKCMA